MAQGRRWLGFVPRLTRRAWEDVAQELEELLRRLWSAESDGIPPGFNDVDPGTVRASASATDTGDPGTETQGWAAADHVHVASTAVPEAVGVEIPKAEGTAIALTRSDHRHEVEAWRTAGVTVDGGPSVVGAGFKGYVPAPYSGTIVGWSMVADQVGDCVMDVWKSHRTPTALNSVCGVAKPTLSGAETASGGVVGWGDLSVRKGDVFGFTVDSAATVTVVTLVVRVRES